MAVGSWAELTTNGINSTILSATNAGGVGGNNIPYSNQMAWNPVTKQIKFACSDHGSSYMVEQTYDVASNTWSWTRANGFGAAGTHAYGHFCVRPDTGDLYSRHNGGGVASENTYRRLAGSGTWTQYTASPQVYTQIGVCAVWWPGSSTGGTALQGMGAAGCYIVFEIALGSIVAFNPLTSTWTSIATPSTSPPVDPYQTAAAYSSTYNCTVFGGGGGSGGDNRRMFRLNQNATVTELTPCPVSIGEQKANLQVDPVTGKFLIWGGGSNARRLFEFVPTGTGTYTEITSTRRPPASGLHGVSDPSGGPGGPDGLVSCPLPEHGVIAYMSAAGASYANMFLYKHA
jgi:hypothetical protein